jgi:hypothetical protein
VGDLCLAENNPANPGAWLDQNLSSERSLFARGADLTLYGTKRERTLQIFAPGLSLL